MKQKWSAFENRILTESRFIDIFIRKIPNGIIYGKGTTYSVKTPCDFFLFINGIGGILDAKHTVGDSFNCKSQLLNDKKIHQYENLKEAHENGNVAGILIHFEGSRRIAWANIPCIDQSIAEGKSLTINSPGIIMQKDDEPIHLRVLMAKDIKLITERLGRKI